MFLKSLYWNECDTVIIADRSMSEIWETIFDYGIWCAYCRHLAVVDERRLVCHGFQLQAKYCDNRKRIVS